MKQNIELTELFNVVVNNSNETLLDFKKVNQVAIPLGFIVKPEACYQSVLYWLQTKSFNYNSTFYKTWEDVTSKSRIELFFDQILHYATTYGTEFALGNGFTQNDGDVPEFTFDDYKIIDVVTPEEMYKRCYDILLAGIALKKETCSVVCDYIYNYCVENQKDIDIDPIKNREAKITLYKMFKKHPSDKFELLKYIFYLATDETMLINSPEFYAKVKANRNKFIWNELTEVELIKLASIFLRYKKMILISKYDKTASAINKLSRLAKKYHQPMKIGFWESLNSTEHTYDEVYEKSAELTNFKLITLINMLTNNSKLSDGDKKMFVIRNGKVFFKDVVKKTIGYDSTVVILGALIQRLIDNMKSKACTVKYPTDLVLACPTSEKNYVGNIPFGSYFNMSHNNIVGIYWRNEWGTRDFDLSMNDVNGGRIGWDSAYYKDDSSVVYSGDMTNANPEATELLYCKNTMPNGVIYINRYSGEDNSKYKFFYANEVPSTKDMMNYMVDPNNIKVDVMCESTSAQQMLGVVADGKFFFCNLGNGSDRVAHRSDKLTPKDIFNIFVRKNESSLPLKGILTNAGFKEYVPEYDEDGNITNKPDLDLTDLEKDTLIKLFS